MREKRPPAEPGLGIAAICRNQLGTRRMGRGKKGIIYLFLYFVYILHILHLGCWSNDMADFWPSSAIMTQVCVHMRESFIWSTSLTSVILQLEILSCDVFFHIKDRCMPATWWSDGSRVIYGKKTSCLRQYGARGKIFCWKSFMLCYNDMYHLSKHFCRSHTSLHGKSIPRSQRCLLTD